MIGALEALLAQPIAHRGLHDARAGLIENSLGAAEAAIAAGFAIECDVRLAGDGEAFVFHDETLDRLTDETGRFDQREGSALSALSLRQSARRESIPSLPYFLSRLAGRVPLVIELKRSFDQDCRLADRVVACLESYRGAVGLKSFDPDLMARCRTIGAPCPLGLVGPAETRGLAPIVWQDYDFVSWHVDDLDALRAGQPSIPAMSWTIRSRADEACARKHRAQIVFEHHEPGRAGDES